VVRDFRANMVWRVQFHVVSTFKPKEGVLIIPC